MTTPRSILVLGAGELGLAVLRALAAHPRRDTVQLSVTLRPSTLTSPSPSQTQLLTLLSTLSITPVPADFSSASLQSLTTLFSSFHTVLNCTGMALSASTQPLIARAAIAANVAVYLPWQYGIDYDVIGRASSQDLFDSQLDVRALLRAQEATRWVIVSTGMFISFLFEPAFGVVEEGWRKVVGLGAWGNEITVTAPEDIGRVVAEIVLGEEVVHGVVYVAGDTVSMEGLVEVVERVSGRRVESEVKSVEVLKQELKEEPEDGMRKYRVVFAEGRGTAWEKEKSWNAVRGIRTLSVEEWARENWEKVVGRA